jgi:hypothetical protein
MVDMTVIFFYDDGRLDNVVKYDCITEQEANRTISRVGTIGKVNAKIIVTSAVVN